jgi:hypothetical protein
VRVIGGDNPTFRKRETWGTGKHRNMPATYNKRNRVQVTKYATWQEDSSHVLQAVNINIASLATDVVGFADSAQMYGSPIVVLVSHCKDIFHEGF